MATLLQRIGLVGGGVVLLIALIGNTIVGVGAVREQAAGFEEMYTAQRILRRITVLKASLSDAETGQRGFLLAQGDRYLDPYLSGTVEASASLDTLDALVVPFPDKAARMPLVRSLVRRKFAEMEETIRLARAGQADAALAIVEGDRGQVLMDSLRLHLDEMETGALARRDRDRRLALGASRRALQTIAVSNALLLLVVSALGWWLRRTLRERERAAADLLTANAAIGQALAEREAALANVHAMQAQMVQQEKLAGLGRLTAGVAHELKNPLNFVNNFAQLANEMSGELQSALEAGDADEARALLPDLRLNTAKVMEHGRRADEIVRTMLVHARGVSGERQAVPLDPVLAQAAQQAIGPGDRRPVEVVRRDDTVGVAVWGVPSALTRLFLNLIENAVQAVRERAGATEGLGYTPTVWLEVRRGFDRMGRAVAIVSVEDNGAGIPESVLPRIFEPFYTTKGPGQGTGLGLSLAYDIAVGHGGTLAASRARGGGALFTVTLPLDPPPGTDLDDSSSDPSADR